MTHNAELPENLRRLAADRESGIIPTTVLNRRPQWASLTHSDVEGIEHMDDLDDALTILWSTPNLSTLPDVDAQFMRVDEYHPGRDEYTSTEPYGRIYANYKASHPDLETLEIVTVEQARAVAVAALALVDAFERANAEAAEGQTS